MDKLSMATLGFRSRGGGSGPSIVVPVSFEADAAQPVLEANSAYEIVVAETSVTTQLEVDMSELSSVIDATVNSAEAGC